MLCLWGGKQGPSGGVVRPLTFTRSLPCPLTFTVLAVAGTWGPQAEWGEHEMDYILFIRAPAGGLTLQPNPEEVMVSLPACC